MDILITWILAGHIVEFSYHGRDYLIQQENNKGWNYLSLWCTAPDTVCLGRAFFDIFDGISEEIVWELCSQPCLDGSSVQEVLQNTSLDFHPA